MYKIVRVSIEQKMIPIISGQIVTHFSLLPMLRMCLLFIYCIIQSVNKAFRVDNNKYEYKYVKVLALMENKMNFLAGRNKY